MKWNADNADSADLRGWWNRTLITQIWQIHACGENRTLITQIRQIHADGGIER
jgi:hypothetical protein